MWNIPVAVQKVHRVSSHAIARIDAWIAIAVILQGVIVAEQSLLIYISPISEQHSHKRYPFYLHMYRWNY